MPPTREDAAPCTGSAAVATAVAWVHNWLPSAMPHSYSTLGNWQCVPKSLLPKIDVPAVHL